MKKNKTIAKELQKAREETAQLIDVIRSKPATDVNEASADFLIAKALEYVKTIEAMDFEEAARLRDAIVHLRAIAEGAREIVLTGVNTGDFGKSTGERLIDLLRALDALPGDTRIRISSIEPDLLTDDIIRLTAASPHLMPHFHLPLQAGSDEVLRLMHRRYDTALFARKVQAIRRAIPHAFIGVDVITGVHGETDALFEQGRAFIDALPASQLHVFTYSERAGTRMLQMPHPVPVPERRRRNEVLQAISRQKHHAFCESQIGRPARVLWEGRRRADRMAGFTENYVRVEAPYRPRLINTIQPVTLGGWNDDHTALTIES